MALFHMSKQKRGIRPDLKAYLKSCSLGSLFLQSLVVPVRYGLVLLNCCKQGG